MYCKYLNEFIKSSHQMWYQFPWFVGFLCNCIIACHFLALELQGRFHANPIDCFQYFKIQFGSNGHVFSILLFVSFKPHYQGEFWYIEKCRVTQSLCQAQRSRDTFFLSRWESRCLSQYSLFCSSVHWNRPSMHITVVFPAGKFTYLFNPLKMTLNKTIHVDG